MDDKNIFIEWRANFDNCFAGSGALIYTKI